jgi:hypothetical protein
MTPVKLAVLIVALALACVSATISIHGLTAIFAGAFWPVITLGAALEAEKLVGDAWLTENWHSAPSPPAPDSRGDDRRVDESKRSRRVRLPHTSPPRSHVGGGIGRTLLHQRSCSVSTTEQNADRMKVLAVLHSAAVRDHLDAALCGS